MRAFSWLVAGMSHFSLRPVIGHLGTDGRFFKYWKLINYFHHCGMQNQNIPGKPARHQGFSPPFSCWQPPAIGDTLNHLGADWSLKRRSKNETRYHRDQAITGHCILKNPPGCLIIACLLIANICSGFHLTKQLIRAPHKLVWSSDFSFSCCVLILYILTLAIRTPRKFFFFHCQQHAQHHRASHYYIYPHRTTQRRGPRPAWQRKVAPFGGGESDLWFWPQFLNWPRFVFMQ